MRQIIVFLMLFILTGFSAFSQGDSVLKIIFVPHPRSEDMVHQSTLPAIEKIDFSKFGMIMLGGDLTYSPSKNVATLNYCDSVFNISSPNTLWGFGNHDVESGNRDLIKKITGRNSYYAYNRDGLTFMVLDAELNSTGFTRTFILGDQLQMIKNVCDTITNSKYLILLQSRYMWMINSDYFKPKLDSVAASSKAMDTTNFYSDIYPLLRKVKAKGIQVMCFAGDKSFINVKYSPEDSITFFAARMAPSNSDSINDVIVLHYNLLNQTMTSSFVSLEKIDKTVLDTAVSNVSKIYNEQVLNVWQSGTKEISVQLKSENNANSAIQIYSMSGVLVQSFKLNTNDVREINMYNRGVYLVKAVCGNSVFVRKIVCMSN